MNNSISPKPGHHIILYAKGQYEKGVVWKDLSIIISRTALMDFDCITKQDVLAMVIRTVVDYHLDTNDKVAKFLYNLNEIPKLGDTISDKNVNLATLETCLYELRYAQVNDLVSPDPKVLPIKNSDKAIKWNKVNDADSS